VLTIQVDTHTLTLTRNEKLQEVLIFVSEAFITFGRESMFCHRRRCKLVTAATLFLFLITGEEKKMRVCDKKKIMLRELFINFCGK
jgi:hypothetical protein